MYTLKKLVSLIALCFVAAGMLATATSCSSSQHGAQIQSAAALAFNGAAVALELLDAQETDRLDAISQPTAADVAGAQARVDRLKRARDALQIARAWVAGERSADEGRAALRDAAQLLKLAIEEARAAGHDVPRAVDDGLAVAEAWLATGAQ